MTRVLIVVLALLAAGLAMWRVSTTAPAPEAPYFPPGHMQITANNRAGASLDAEKSPELVTATTEAPSVSVTTAQPTSSTTTASPPSPTTPLANPNAPRQASIPVTKAADKGIAGGETAPTVGEVQTALAAWEVAWESRDVDTYMMFYHPNFPDKTAFSRQKNGVMVRAKNIRINVQDLKVTVDAQKTRAVFLQHYKSDTYESKDIKTQIWVSGPDGPRIIEEFTRARRGPEGE